MNQENKGFKVLGGNEIQGYYKRGIKGYIENKYIKTDQSLIKPNSVLLQRIIAHIENPTDHLRISGTIFEDPSYKIVDTVYQITLDKEISNKYVLAIINSNFMNWFVKEFNKTPSNFGISDLSTFAIIFIDWLSLIPESYLLNLFPFWIM